MESKTKRVVFPVKSHFAIQRGIAQMVNAIRPTYGARSRVTAVSRVPSSRSPELLDSGGTIARRIIQLKNKDEDMGAMLLRQALWNLQEKVGDGTVTAAILFQEIFDRGLHHLTYGGNALILRGYLEQGLRLIVEKVQSYKTPIEGREALAGIARTICGDDQLARLLGEIMDIVGPYGQVEIRSSRGRKLEREYVEGMYHEGGILSRVMITEPNHLKAELTDASILITDLDIQDPRPLVHVIEVALHNGVQSLMILAKQMSNACVGLLMAASKEPKKFRVIAAKYSIVHQEKLIAMMEDLAALTGGRPIASAAGDSLDKIVVDDFGKARQVWADGSHFGIVGPKGDPRRLRTHIQALQTYHRGAKENDARDFLQQRIGRLKGGSATLWIGANTETQIEVDKELADRTIRAMRAALLEGVIPGGGSVLLSCQPMLHQRMKQASSEDERAAYRILHKAMEIPARTLIENAGYDAHEVLPEIRRAGEGYGFDVLVGKVVKMTEAGIYDVTNVLTSALHGAISSAALALTVDVLVHRKKLEPSVKP